MEQKTISEAIRSRVKNIEKEQSGPLVAGVLFPPEKIVIRLVLFNFFQQTKTNDVLREEVSTRVLDEAQRVVTKSTKVVIQHL
ncbi:unnamed protein product [Amoebophrya sp. A25]|nr:unnamed protein product [Amoebophrya sp. A25]|eukprot:GSA25T00011432001.1